MNCSAELECDTCIVYNRNNNLTTNISIRSRFRWSNETHAHRHLKIGSTKLSYLFIYFYFRNNKCIVLYIRICFIQWHQQHAHHQPVHLPIFSAALIISKLDLISNNMSKLGDKMNAQHDASRILSTTLTHDAHSPQHIIIVVVVVVVVHRRDNTSTSTTDNNPIKNRAYNQCTSVCVCLCVQ